MKMSLCGFFLEIPLYFWLEKAYNRLKGGSRMKMIDVTNSHYDLVTKQLAKEIDFAIAKLFQQNNRDNVEILEAHNFVELELRL